MIVYIPVEPNKKKMILENGINIEKDYNKKIGLRVYMSSAYRDF